MIILKAQGILYSSGEIFLNSLKSIHWKELSDKAQPNLPDTIRVELSISFDENELLSGKDGIVWGSYDLRQAEIIQNSLLAQNINSTISKIESSIKSIYLIKILLMEDITTAKDFIWKNEGGLRLKPDWTYTEGEANKSFELWLNGN
ncbi:MAG: hypothetical protein K6T54_05410 [Ignavibacterium sp.]|nr:hypothetical protein [Ignavibacterium sp.]